MDLNIQAIADAKIQEMHDSGKITDAIESGIESLILKAIKDALDGYALKRDIENQMSENVSSIVKDIGFSAYNGFIAQKVKDITENVMREDVAQKIQKVFDDMLIIRHDGIKLSEIVEAYRQYLFDSVDEADKWEWREFTCDVQEEVSGSCTWHTVRLHEKEFGRYEKPEIEFKILVMRDAGAAKISLLYLDGRDIKEALKLGTLSKVDALLCNLYFNETPIILDLEDVDDSNGYDIDC